MEQPSKKDRDSLVEKKAGIPETITLERITEQLSAGKAGSAEKSRYRRRHDKARSGLTRNRCDQNGY